MPKNTTPDYYAILGVVPNATLEDIRRAYREKVLRCHPDRGGNHEQTVLLNQAWEVLTDPDRRAEFDRVRSAQDAALRWRWETVEREVHTRAQDYPRQYEAFVKWVDALTRDVTQAEYRVVGGGGFWFPLALRSKSGALFVGIGALLGLLLGYWQMWWLAAPPSLWGPPSPPPWYAPFNHPGTGLLRALAFCAAGGASLGIALHWVLRAICRGLTRKRTGSAETTSADPVPAACALILSCEHCGRKLRVPRTDRKLRITCPACHHAFDCEPAS